MEIKVICSCGTKYKFDVEPVNGRMPAPISCPQCGADGTAQANDILRQMEPVPPSPAPILPQVVSPTPVAAGSLKINRPAAHTAEAAPSAGGLPQPPPPFERVAGRAPQPAKIRGQVKRVLTAVVTVLLVAFGAWRFGAKWYRRLSTVATIAAVVTGKGTSNSGSEEGAKNLWYDDCAVLFIKHTNHVEIAEACKEYWKDKLHKNLSVTETMQEMENKGEWELVPEHNGYVRIIGAFEWPIEQLEGLAKHLSNKFNTVAFEWGSEHFADTYHFGVYEQGNRPFHCKMDVKISQDNADEIVTAEGKDWAIAHGFKPGAEGFKEFNVLDADKITRKMGMKLGDEQDGAAIKGMLMKEEVR